MITILHANSEEIAAQIELAKLLEHLPIEMRPRAQRYRVDRDAYNYTIGRLLLLEALKISNLPINKFNTINYNEFGKPSIDGLFFSLSHSETQVLCAFTQVCEIGIDIEKRQKVELDHFKDWFSDKNWAHVYAANDPFIPFFKLWAQKESVLKALGTGLSQLKDVEILNDQEAFDGQQKWYLQELDLIEGYNSALCMEMKQKRSSIEVLSWTLAPI